MKYLKTTSEDSFAVTLIFSGGKIPTTINESNPAFKELMDYLTSTPEAEHDEDHINQLVFPALNAGHKLTVLSERVSVSENNVFFDGDPLEAPEAEQLLRLVREGGKIAPLVAFLEKVRQNPSVDSQDSLYRYLEKWNFTITNDGDIIAYKGVKADGKSVYTGTAFVDNIQVSGHIPNPVGSIISMPRSKVESDNSIGCASGLHAGTYSYAKGWSQGKLLTVKINPRDVVSVPSDTSFQKIRSCRYEVLAEATVEYTEAVWDDEDFDEDDDYDNEDDYDIDDDDFIDEDVEPAVPYNDYRERLNEIVGDVDSSELDNVDVINDTVQVVNPAAKTVTVPLTGNTTLDTVNQAIEDGEHLTFTYVKADGTVKQVNGFIPADVESGRNGLIVRGKNVEDEYRTYKLDNISDLNVYSINPADAPVEAPRATLTTPWSND